MISLLSQPIGSFLFSSLTAFFLCEIAPIFMKEVLSIEKKNGNSGQDFDVGDLCHLLYSLNQRDVNLRIHL